MRCTGQCCQRFTVSPDRVTLRRWMDVERDVEAAKIWTLLRYDGTFESGAQAFRCTALTPTGCSLEREDRPLRMCNEYPYGTGTPCWACGALSDAEARGVALMKVEQPHGL